MRRMTALLATMFLAPTIPTNRAPTLEEAVALARAEGLTSDPTAVSWGSGRIDVFARGPDNALWHKWYENQWSGWESLGGSLASGPDVASWGSGRLDVFARGTDNTLVHKWYDGQWSGWESLGGGLASDPSAVAWGPGRLDVFARGADNGLWHIWYAGSWSGWESLGGVLASGPDVSSWGSGRLDVFARGTDNSLYHKSYEGQWSGWESLGGGLTSDPSAVSWGSGRLDVFARGADNALWHNSYANSWFGWESLGGVLSSGPDASSWDSGRLDVFARGNDNGLYHKSYSGAWSGWQGLGAPAATSAGTGQSATFTLASGSVHLAFGEGAQVSTTYTPSNADYRQFSATGPFVGAGLTVTHGDIQQGGVGLLRVSVTKDVPYGTYPVDLTGPGGGTARLSVSVGRRNGDFVSVTLGTAANRLSPDERHSMVTTPMGGGRYEVRFDGLAPVTMDVFTWGSSGAGPGSGFCQAWPSRFGVVMSEAPNTRPDRMVLYLPLDGRERSIFQPLMSAPPQTRVLTSPDCTIALAIGGALSGDVPYQVEVIDLVTGVALGTVPFNSRLVEAKVMATGSGQVVFIAAEMVSGTTVSLRTAQFPVPLK